MPLYSIETYGELHPHLEEDWLITNGIGGFASGTVVGCNTRRYHGLLCAATLPPVGRTMLLNRIGEILCVDGREDQLLEFSVNQFNDRFHPRGDRYLRRFDLEDSIARWQYEIEGIAITKQVQMSWLHNITAIRYTIDPRGKNVELRLLPFVRLLDFHALRHGKADLQTSSDSRSCTVSDADRQVHIATDAGSFVPAPDWWFNYTYAIEIERGQDSQEDLFTPGRFILSTKKPATITLWAGEQPSSPADWDALAQQRRAAIASTSAPRELSPTIRRLTHAANDFVVRRRSPDGKDGSTIIAGYPWFADWGRDTMISLPGLLLTPGRYEQARQVLSVFAQYVDRGMIPNRFDDYSNEPSYNTVDASLWFVHACFEYARLSKDTRTLDSTLRPACEAIIDGYTRGTRYNIKVDPADGLVSQGDADTQLTWMDAKCDGVAFTPRQGKPVEINALWYHALTLLGRRTEAQRVSNSFQKAFWLSPFRGLADVVDGSRRDASIRPNQIFAVGLPNSPLTRDQQAAVVETVRRELLTPFGLRTLARGEPGYSGAYRGPQKIRDQAYHNGTVWPWLLGAFLDAYIKVNQRSPESLDQARRWLQPLIDCMSTACIGQIAEIFEANEPHRPVGAFAQAWSIAEVLRLSHDLGM